jgi:hypothetical protein
MFSDTFHDTLADAMEEVARRRNDPQGKELVTRIDRSPYGGFRVRSMPADYFIDLLADGPVPGGLNSTRRRWEEMLV